MSIKNSNDLILKKQPSILMAEDSYSVEMLEKITNGEHVKVRITVPRNVKFHRKFFALLGIVFRAQPEPRAIPTVDALLDAIKFATGNVRYFKDLQGNEHAVPDSISFGKMDEIKFSEFYEAAVSVVLERVIPHIKRADLEQQIYNFLGEAGPDALRGR